MFRRIGALTYRRRWTVVAVWFAVMVAGALSMGPLTDRLTAEFNGSDRLESARVLARVQNEGSTGGDIAIVIDGVDPSAPQPAVMTALDEIAVTPGVVSVVDPWRADLDELRATDQQAALVVVSFANGLDPPEEEELIEHVTRIADGLVSSGAVADVLVGGEPVILHEFEVQAERDLARGEAIALPIAFLAMLVIFGGVRAASTPLLVAAAAFTTSIIALLGATFVMDDVSVFAINVISLLGIGLGIDYGLLLVSRFREERGHGHTVGEAVETTVATAGVTVVFSALTVAVAMSGMFVFAEPTMTSFGIGGLAAVLLSMVAALTLLPALLGIMGAKITPASSAPVGEGAFFRLSRAVQRFALPVVLVVGTGLAALAIPFLDVRLENGDARSLPRSSEARAAALELGARVPARGADPFVVFADAPAGGSAVAAYADELAATPGVAAVAFRAGFDPAVTVIDVVPAGTSQSDLAQGLVEQIRRDAAPFPIEVGGVAAQTIDTNDLIAERMPYAVAIVVGATLVLLFLMTGSIAIPLKAVVMNVLSLGASFGALVWVFQDGNLSGLLGFDSVGSVDMWMPVLIFLFAFGLSMDYEVFLLSRIKEIHDETGDNDLSVSLGLQRTGRIISSAALLIVVVFSGFAAGEVLTIKQLGIGMALAVVVDAAIVRSLLVPATMKLLGDWNWWAPAPLRRFHDRFGLHEPPSSEPLLGAVPGVIDDGLTVGTDTAREPVGVG